MVTCLTSLNKGQKNLPFKQFPIIENVLCKVYVAYSKCKISAQNRIIIRIN